MSKTATEEEKITIRAIKDLIRPYLLPGKEENPNENQLGIRSDRYDKITRSTYKSYSGMRERCLLKRSRSYRHYGGRGIGICDRWLPTESNRFIGLYNFLVDMGVKPTIQHTIDRINNNGNYEPGNCRWATMLEQANNKSNNRRIGSKTAPQIAREKGVKKSTFYGRLYNCSNLTDDEIENFTYEDMLGLEKYFWKGECRYTNEIAKMENIEHSHILRRIEKYGWDIEMAVYTPIMEFNMNPIIFQGILKSIMDWSRLLKGHNTSRTTINRRRNEGLSSRDILMPISRRVGKPFVDVSILLIKGKNKAKLFENYIVLVEETGMLLEDVIKALEDPNSNIKYWTYVVNNREKYKGIMDFKKT